MTVVFTLVVVVITIIVVILKPKSVCLQTALETLEKVRIMFKVINKDTKKQKCGCFDVLFTLF